MNAIMLQVHNMTRREVIEMLSDVRWLPVKSAAIRLGVSRTRVYRLVSEGKLPWVRLDGTLLVDARAVEARVARGRKEVA